MKKLLLLSLLMMGIASASTGEHTKRMNTMKKLENGMETILKGLMYNNKKILLKGVDIVKENTKDIKSFNIKNEEGKGFKRKKYAETEAKAIAVEAERIFKAFKKANRNRMLDSFRKLQNRCMSCHALIREW
ncbi:MAG: hypothetical protein LGB03_03135 [Sulfurovum sp.]|nr:hypothetical protein [Sulfurovum sp.]MCB4783274.1 hypothetical protein [Sulfurovum sp.]